jgi:hypothetical protein
MPLPVLEYNLEWAGSRRVRCGRRVQKSSRCRHTHIERDAAQHIIFLRVLLRERFELRGELTLAAYLMNARALHGAGGAPSFAEALLESECPDSKVAICMQRSGGMQRVDALMHARPRQPPRSTRCIAPWRP